MFRTQMGYLSHFLWLAVAAYIGQTVFSFYGLFTYDDCTEEKFCLYPSLKPNSSGAWPTAQLFLYTRVHHRNKWSEYKAIFEKKDLSLEEGFEQTVPFKVPAELAQNGTLWMHLVVTCADGQADQLKWRSEDQLQFSFHELPKLTAFNLIGSENGKNQAEEARPIPHLQTLVPVNLVLEPLVLDRRRIPHGVRERVRGPTHQQDQKQHQQHYFPLFSLDPLRLRLEERAPVRPHAQQLNLTVSYRPISWGRLRLALQLADTFHDFKALGFGDKDVDDLKGMFADINFTFLALMVTVATVHLLFDFLTFKNDVQFWRGRRTTVGISTRALLWRCASEWVVLLYLWDERASYLILAPAAVGVLVECWKLRRALKLSLRWSTTGWPLRLRFGEQSAAEKRTGRLDTEAMTYLTYLLIPLCVAGALYNLIYVPQKSWFSWLIKCAANCIYAFGFLFMLPQLFLNYKLKSVAHLPWKAFMYKAFNTFIDDVFAFIITMPTSHRLACFRDDIVFVIYLYQRYLYPVDKTRVNEFGESFEDKPDQSAEEKKNE